MSEAGWIVGEVLRDVRAWMTYERRLARPHGERLMKLEAIADRMERLALMVEDVSMDRSKLRPMSETLFAADYAGLYESMVRALTLSVLVGAEMAADQLVVAAVNGRCEVSNPYKKSAAHEALHALAVERGWIKEGER